MTETDEEKYWQWHSEVISDNLRRVDAELAAVRRALNAYPDSNLASLASVMMSQRRLLAETLVENWGHTFIHLAEPKTIEDYHKALKLAESIITDEPAPAGNALARDMLARVWQLAERRASYAEIIEAAAWGLGVNERPDGDALAGELIVRDVVALRDEHRTTWRDKPESYWLARLMQEVGELGSSLVGDHDDPPEWELKQIAAICLNWLEMRQERNDDTNN